LTKSHIKIIAVGKHLTHFKHCKTLEQKRVSIQVESVAGVQKYLKDNNGKLVKDNPPLKKAA